MEIQPLHIDGVRDYHCHCDFSIDATGTIEEYCQVALKRNLAEICFTTHYDANPNSDGRINFIMVNGKKKKVMPENLAPYVDEVHRVADKFFLLGLSVKLGVEIGWYEGCEETIEKLKDRFQFDYVLCGIHELDNICFCCRQTKNIFFEKYSANELAEKYFQQVVFAARSKLFDTIAHLQYYLKYGVEHYGEDIINAHQPYLEETFKALMDNKTGLEINTASLRQGLKDYYPRIEIINAAKKAGIIIEYLGSDAHHPEQVGYDFEAAIPLVPDTIRSCDD
ncbi:MAG: histidinol-phosphatase HisJ family protein [Candidatus Zixiibacteriota bacterium]